MIGKMGSKEKPTMMRALELRSYDGGPESLVLVERPIPRPGRGQVLVRIEAAPIHYHDLLILRGLYGLKRKLPVIAGSEGSGVVVASGNDIISVMLRGKRVVCGPDPGEDGTWAEYILTTTDFCVPLRNDISFEQGSNMMINPLTAWVLVDIAKQEGHRAIIQTAAAGALGRMILNLAQYRGLPMIHIVRRKEHVELLRTEGAEYVLNSSDSDFERSLKDLSHRLDATIAFDAVSGEMPGKLLQAMPLKSRVLVYAGLSDQDCLLNWRTVLFHNKAIQGFWLPNWLKARSRISRFLAATRAQRFFASRINLNIKGRYSLDQASRAVDESKLNMSGGKILFVRKSEGT